MADIKTNIDYCNERSVHLGELLNANVQYAENETGRGTLTLAGEPFDGMENARNKDILLFMQYVTAYAKTKRRVLSAGEK
jgi:hypothetical protein